MGLFDDMDNFEETNGFGDSSTGFGETSGDDFGSDLDFSNNNSFGENNSFDNGFNSENNADADFSGAFDEEPLGQGSGGGGGLTKQAIITIAVGIIGIIIVIFLATRISSCSKQEEETIKNNETNVEQSTNRDGQDVNDIMSDNKVDRPSSNNNTQPNKNNTQSSNQDSWISIDKNQEVEFNTEYQELIFTITGISHLAKKVDINGNLVVKTQLTGGISGLSGSYTLDIPYSKGVKLVVGDSFTVKVQLGTYSEKTVVGEIIY